MIMKKILFLLQVMLVNMAFAQLRNGLGNIIIPSPTVAELAKYTSIPVGYYNGITNISIPLGEVVCGDLKVPVYLSYHSGGIRVDQIASEMGLGWSLNAGGVIGQTIVGANDISGIRKIITVENIEDNVFPSMDQAYDYFDSTGTSNTVDNNPDLFHYNFLNYSGQFLVDENKAFHDLRGKKDVLFEIGDNGALHAYDLYGTKFDFDIHERTHYLTCSYTSDVNGTPVQASMPLSKNNNITAYKLSRITSIDGKHTIDFSYTDGNFSYDDNFSGYLIYDLKKQAWSSTANLTRSTIQNSVKNLTRITASNGVYFTFQYSDQARKDLPGAYALKIIRQYGSQGQLIKSWTLQYDYFESKAKHPTQHSLNYRLKLMSVTESGLSEEPGKIYKLSYYGDDPAEPQMPPRDSFCCDSWGYCNADITSYYNPIAWLFPRMDQGYSLTDQQKLTLYSPIRKTELYTKPAGIFSSGGNKYINPQYVKTYSLKAITYPTGGRSEFVYESNDYSYLGSSNIGRKLIAGGQRIKEIRHYDNKYTSPSLTQKYTYELFNGQSSGALLAEPNHLTSQFLPEPIGGGTGGTVLVNNLKLCSGSFTPLNSFGGDFIGYSRVKETTDAGAVIYDYYSPKEFPMEYKIHFLQYIGESNGVFPNHELVPYCKFANNPNPEIYSPSLAIETLIDPFENGFQSKVYGRGLIKQEQVLDTNGKILKRKEYNYDFVDLRRVSGMTYGPPPQYAQTGSRIPCLTFSCYNFPTGRADLKSTISTDYFEDKAISVKEEFKYNSYNLVNRIASKMSNRDSITTIIRYPQDFDVAPYSDMCLRKMINYPIEVVKKKNGKVVNAELTTYTSGTNTYVPWQKYSLKFINPPTEDWFYNGVSNNYGEADRTVTKYDNCNNPVEITDRNGVKQVYLWGYGKERLVVVLSNASYDQIIELIPDLDAILTNSEFDPTALDALRSELRNAEITTYTYIGDGLIETIRDSRGVLTKYAYDNQSRLLSITDDKGNLLTKYSYQYRNQ